MKLLADNRKGAFGQAMQNMNLMNGWDETCALPARGNFIKVGAAYSSLRLF